MTHIMPFTSCLASSCGYTILPSSDIRQENNLTFAFPKIIIPSVIYKIQEFVPQMEAVLSINPSVFFTRFHRRNSSRVTCRGRVWVIEGGCRDEGATQNLCSGTSNARWEPRGTCLHLPAPSHLIGCIWNLEPSLFFPPFSSFFLMIFCVFVLLQRLKFCQIVKFPFKF